MLFHDLRQPAHGKAIKDHRRASGQTCEFLIHRFAGDTVRTRKLPGQTAHPGRTTVFAKCFYQLTNIPVTAGVLFRVARNEKLDYSRYVRFRHGSWPRQCEIQRG